MVRRFNWLLNKKGRQLLLQPSFFFKIIHRMNLPDSGGFDGTFISEKQEFYLNQNS